MPCVPSASIAPLLPSTPSRESFRATTRPPSLSARLALRSLLFASASPATAFTSASPRLAARPSPPRAAPPLASAELHRYDLLLTKPLGLLLEQAEGEGLLVAAVLPGGSACASASVWPEDRLLEVEGRAVRADGLDAALAALRDAPVRCRLTLGRARGAMGALRLRDGTLAFASPRSELMPLAREHRLPCEFRCTQGTCGSCEMLLRDEESGQVRPVRMCVAKMPSGSSASLMPWEVLTTDSAAAEEYYEGLRRRMPPRKK
ncbi:hypothetical protein AB1Y20_021795 [Prymnesium parvum]|uniref:PDZ domain-containing protein n=1 Tax=Prymnesium parvum TaxID=97485 RepID=A0AB34JJA6_PRYPA